MPTYHYKCKACDREFEEFQSMSDDPLVKCPSCGKKKLVRLITGAGLVFKGSGFYLTDYKKRAISTAEASKEAPSSGGESSPDASSTGGKSSGKPPEKTAGKSAGKTGEKKTGPSGPPRPDKT